MDFQNLMGGNCGDANSLEQFAQHMVQDVALQDSFGQPSTSSDNFMLPQSFAMHDLMNEMEALDPQRSCMPATTTSLNSQWNTEYQETIDYGNMMCSSGQSLWNNGLPSSQIYLPSYQPNNFVPQLEENSERLPNKYGVTVDRLDQLDDSYQYERQENKPLENKVQLDAEPEPVFQKNWRGIPIHDEKVLSDRLESTTEAKTFIVSLLDYAEKCSYEERKLDDPNQGENQARHGIIEYPHINDNPMRDCDSPITNFKQELSTGNIKNAILNADEAARQNPGDINRWLVLGNFLNEYKLKNLIIYFVANQIIKLEPNHIPSYMIMIGLLLECRCYCAAFGMMVHWLQNHESYGDIPLNFTMKENSSGPIDRNARTWTDSNKHIIDGVKNMLLTAARRNPTNPDLDVQLFLSYIFHFTMDYEKSADCLTTIAHPTAKNLKTPFLYLTGLNVFLSGKPHEALKYLLIGVEKCKNKRRKANVCELIGIIYYYLTNYREAIRYFREALEIDPSEEEIEVPTTLKAENELCLLLYYKLYKKQNSKS